MTGGIYDREKEKERENGLYVILNYQLYIDGKAENPPTPPLVINVKL